MPTVLERLKQGLADMEKRGRGDGPLAKQLRAQIEASEAFPNSSAEQLYRLTPIQMSKAETQDKDTPQEEEQVSGDPTPMDEFLTEEHWAKNHDPEVAKMMVELGLITPRKDSTKNTD